MSSTSLSSPSSRTPAIVISRFVHWLPGLWAGNGSVTLKSVLHPTADGPGGASPSAGVVLLLLIRPRLNCDVGWVGVRVLVRCSNYIADERVLGLNLYRQWAFVRRRPTQTAPHRGFCCCCASAVSLNGENSKRWRPARLGADRIVIALLTPAAHHGVVFLTGQPQHGAASAITLCFYHAAFDVPPNVDDDVATAQARGFCSVASFWPYLRPSILAG